MRTKYMQQERSLKNWKSKVILWSFIILSFWLSKQNTQSFMTCSTAYPIFLRCIIQRLHNTFVCISIGKQIWPNKQVETRESLFKHFLCAYLSSAETAWVEGWQWRWLCGSCHHCWWAGGRRARQRSPPTTPHWGCDEHAAGGRRTHQSGPASTDPARTDETLHQTGTEQTSMHMWAQTHMGMMGKKNSKKPWDGWDAVNSPMQCTQAILRNISLKRVWDLGLWLISTRCSGGLANLANFKTTVGM